ncbi:MAG: hypothetical protein JNM17_15605 [Archangium sp.]|nr:hypothetical protein [Archangium sp.]
MKRLALILLVAGCSTPIAFPDSGSQADAGGADAGPQCSGVPANFGAICVELDFYRTNACATSASATINAHLDVCDAGRWLTRADCNAELESARWQYGPIGDTYECFYARDGGTLVGAINRSDHGILAAGTVTDCAAVSMTACP